MPAEKSDTEEINKKIDSLVEEIAALRDEFKAVDSLSAMEESMGKLETALDDIGAGIKELAGLDKKVDEVSDSLGNLEKSVDDIKKTSDTSEMVKSVAGIQKSVDQIVESRETEVIIKKLDDLLLYFTDSEVLAKKLDDLQSYVAGLSGIEEKVEELSNSLNETNEIVSIIVRQLDDIERKYNQSIDRITEVAENIETSIATAGSSGISAKAEKKPPKEDTEKPKRAVSKASLPSTIDQIMSDLMDLVTPQTEAKAMAQSLEEARDKLTTMISGHTPVLYQFGTKARELKSYPPTATLNENDIALLSKDIRSWTSKLKEMAKSQ